MALLALLLHPLLLPDRVLAALLLLLPAAAQAAAGAAAGQRLQGLLVVLLQAVNELLRSHPAAVVRRRELLLLLLLLPVACCLAEVLHASGLVQGQVETHCNSNSTALKATEEQEQHMLAHQGWNLGCSRCCLQAAGQD
jgi:hypothetical protein